MRSPLATDPLWVKGRCAGHIRLPFRKLQSPYEVKDKLPVQEVSAYAMGMVSHEKKWLDARPRGSNESDSVCTPHVMDVGTRIPIVTARLGKNTRRRVPVAVARVCIPDPLAGPGYNGQVACVWTVRYRSLSTSRV